MDSIEDKFAMLATNNAPGQEGRQKAVDLGPLLRGGPIEGRPVDFSHGDVNAFEPTPGAFDAFAAGVESGADQAYTEYRGKKNIRDDLAVKLAEFTGAPVLSDDGLIITPGTQGALFLAIASSVSAGDKVAIVQPDYFANRKLVQFFGAEIVPVKLDYLAATEHAGLDLEQLEQTFKAGAKVFVFSNPNNPTGVIYSDSEIDAIARLAQAYGVTVIVDQLYSRLLYQGSHYTHLRASPYAPENVITIIGPSKTESLSGYRVGVAFGAAALIDRMEKLQAIVSLRAGGYSQSVLRTWFAEPAGWMQERIALHQAIRDALLSQLRAVDGLAARTPQAGSYLFPSLPELSVSTQIFVTILRHQAGVTVTPGAEFGPHSTNSIRFNFSQDREVAIQAVERTCALIERYRR
ncbi:pyridoxal phosphate-dependent aminotransferase [Rhodoferax sp.]|uniref:pyridoxal phosphate-dependent aminotransferase n=1 Tax=Rhodoferax sp. TaxID=50421 RepID=UPI0026307BB2|nr:pyridoxal phosphate-dependent aminotransferase [Rhodoferax sp.]MDD3937489.1 pyridoxal phosphate-dependent aminotransferase [Rhodoferax sp.]